MEAVKELQKIEKSQFRARFKLSQKDRLYIESKGWNTIERHAKDFVKTRLAPAQPKNDGKQTPMRGHPVFVAQHATACCCRGCLEKWHGFKKGKELDEDEQKEIVELIMAWLCKEYQK